MFQETASLSELFGLGPVLAPSLELLFLTARLGFCSASVFVGSSTELIS